MGKTISGGAERPGLDGLLPIIRRPRRPLVPIDSHPHARQGVDAPPVPLVAEAGAKPSKSHGTATKTSPTGPAREIPAGHPRP